MLQLLFLLLFASNSVATSISENVSVCEQGVIVELYSSVNKVETEDTDGITCNELSLVSKNYYFQHKSHHQDSLKHKQFSLYASRAPPIFLS
jgi:hypothetical protein